MGVDMLLHWRTLNLLGSSWNCSFLAVSWSFFQLNFGLLAGFYSGSSQAADQSDADNTVVWIWLYWIVSSTIPNWIFPLVVDENVV